MEAIRQTASDAPSRPSLRIRTSVRAGGYSLNHNAVLKVRTSVRAAGYSTNHNATLRVRTSASAGG